MHAPADRRGPGPGALEFPDLGATVYPTHVPEGLAEELAPLYSSLLSTPRWFRLYTDVVASGAVVLSDPRDILLFRIDGDTVDVLNRFFEIGPRSTERACQALFRAIPGARRVHLEVLFPPGDLRLPKRVLYWTDHLVVDLPATVEEYEAGLGKRTRNNLRNFRNRLGRDFHDFHTEVVVPGDRAAALLDQLQTWKSARFAAHGKRTYWEVDKSLSARFLERVQDGGQAHLTTIDGQVAAVRFFFRVGKTVFAVQSAFDPRYERYRLGFVSGYLLICDSVRQGAARVNMMWGTDEYKRHLGAAPVRATLLSVFRSQHARLYSLGEASEVAWRRARRAKRYYWEARHMARRWIDRGALAATRRRRGGE